MPISKVFRIHNFGQFHDIYNGLQNYLKNNCGPSSLSKPSKPFPFWVFQCTFVEKGHMESILLQKLDIKENMQIMICFPTFLIKLKIKK